MRTFGRRIFAAGTVLSVILFLVCLIQWPRSYCGNGYTNDFYGQRVAGFSNGRRGAFSAGITWGLPPTPSSLAVVRDRRWRAAGLEAAYVTLSALKAKTTRQVDFSIKAWQAMFLTAALPVWWLIQRRRHHARRGFQPLPSPQG